jgi:VWFA-related protein
MSFNFIEVCFSLFLLLFSIISQTHFVDAQVIPNDDVIKIETNFISVPVSVIDRNNRYVSNLKKENFKLFENGVEQEIEAFAPTTVPATVVFMIDLSASIDSSNLSILKSANLFFSMLRPDDNLIVVTFGCNVVEAVKLTKVSEIKGKKINLWQKCEPYILSSTRLYEAVDFVINKRLEKVSGRKAIVLLSDGSNEVRFEDHIKHVTAKENYNDLEELDATVYGVQYKYNTIPNQYTGKLTKSELESRARTGEQYMQKLAQLTGGRVFPANTLENLEKAFTQISDELSQQYTLGYYPKTVGEDGERRQIKVRVNIPNVAVRARSEYVYKKSKKQ